MSTIDNLFVNIDGIQYRRIPNFEDYGVSNDGVVISFKRKEPKIMKALCTCEHKQKYLYVFLYKDGKMLKYKIHRAVLSAWCRLPKENEMCLHKNDIPFDNRIENLEWGTNKDNCLDKVKKGRQPRGELCVQHKLSEIDVLSIKKEIKNTSCYKLAKKYRVSHTAIYRAAKGIKWSHLV